MLRKKKSRFIVMFVVFCFTFRMLGAMEESESIFGLRRSLPYAFDELSPFPVGLSGAELLPEPSNSKNK